VKVIHRGKEVLNIGRSSSVKMSLGCPLGHRVPLEINPEKVKNGTG